MEKASSSWIAENEPDEAHPPSMPDKGKDKATSVPPPDRDIPLLMLPDHPEYSRFKDAVKSKLLPPKEDYISEFDKKYPPDKFGEEMTEGARVWKVYRGEVTEQDRELVDGWNKTLDILLIFAGLFSAVATAFIIEGYKQLQPDWGEVTARILLATLATQGAGGNFTLPASLATTATELSQFSPQDMSRWINGMWLCSLALSLAVALLSILVKQWIVQYESRNSGRVPSTREWARRHALYTQGLERWHMHEIVDALPALLHVSLLLFFTGLVLFFWSIDLGIAGCLLVIATCLAGFYSSTLLLSYWHVTCPFYLPWFKHIHGGFDYGLRRFSSILVPRQTLDHLLKVGHAAYDAAVLAWLTSQSPIQDVNAVGVVALGACLPHSPVMTFLRGMDVEFWHIVESKLSSFFDSTYSTMVLYDLSHSTLSSWTNLDEEAPLPPPAYEYLRACHTIVNLSYVLGDRPDLGFIPRSATGFPQMTLLNALLERSSSLYMSAHYTVAVLEMKALLVQQSLATNQLTEITVSQCLSAVDRGMRNKNWNVPPTHVGQVLDLLVRTAPDEKENNSLRLSVGLRFVHWTIVQGRADAILREQLLDIVALCARQRQRTPNDLLVISGHIFQEHGRTIHVHAMELCCHILTHASDYALDEELTQLVLATLHIVFPRMEHDPRPELSQVPQLAAFLGTPLFLQSKERPAWSSAELMRMMPLLVDGGPGNMLSSAAMINLFTTIKQHVIGAGVIYCTQRFTGLLEKNNAVVLDLLVAPEGKPSPWGSLCILLRMCMEMFDVFEEFGLTSEELQRATAFAAKHGIVVEVQLLSTPVTLALYLGNELLRRPRDDPAFALGHELFNVDLLNRLFKRLTPENFKERASAGTDLSMEAALRRLLVDFLPTVAPEKWPELRLGMQAVTEDVGRAGIWAMRDEIDAALNLTATGSIQERHPTT